MNRPETKHRHNYQRKPNQPSPRLEQYYLTFTRLRRALVSYSNSWPACFSLRPPLARRARNGPTCHVPNQTSNLDVGPLRCIFIPSLIPILICHLSSSYSATQTRKRNFQTHKSGPGKIIVCKEIKPMALFWISTVSQAGLYYIL